MIEVAPRELTEVGGGLLSFYPKRERLVSEGQASMALFHLRC